jgi:hypothetical protein
MSNDDAELWRLVAGIDFSDIKQNQIALPESAGGLGWGSCKTEIVERRYRRWLFLVAKYYERFLPPDKEVDQFWHQHMLSSEDYVRDCNILFGVYLHHYPYFGVNGKADYQDLLAAFEDMKRLYRSEFGCSLELDC